MKSYIRFSFLVVIMAFLFIPETFGQRKKTLKDRFSAGLTFGVNFSSVDGDKHKGFKRTGLTGGLRAVTHLSERVDLSFELLYSKLGSQPARDFVSASGFSQQKRVEIDLDFVDVPVLIQYRYRMRDGGFYTRHIHTGLSFSRLMNYTLTEDMTGAKDEIMFSNFESDFKENDIRWMAGMTMYFTEQIGLTFRYAVSLTNLYTSDDAMTDGLSHLKVFYVTVQAVYNFYGPQKRKRRTKRR